MIGRLRGTVVAKGPDGLLLEAGGVGFEVAMTPRALADLPPVGESAVVHTHLHLRDDGVALFGFPTAEERDLFRVLLGATGVGPRLALAILGTLKPADLRRAVVDRRRRHSDPGLRGGEAHGAAADPGPAGPLRDARPRGGPRGREPG